MSSVIPTDYLDLTPFKKVTKSGKADLLTPLLRRIGDQEFTNGMLTKVVETLPEYKALRSKCTSETLRTLIRVHLARGTLEIVRKGEAGVIIYRVNTEALESL